MSTEIVDARSVLREHSMQTTPIGFCSGDAKTCEVKDEIKFVDNVLIDEKSAKHIATVVASNLAQQRSIGPEDLRWSLEMPWCRPRAGLKIHIILLQRPFAPCVEYSENFGQLSVL